MGVGQIDSCFWEGSAGDIITAHTYDLAGNRTAELSSSGSTYYAWDAAGRMQSAEPAGGTVTFIYNTDGQRVVKETPTSSPTGFLYDYKRLLHETDDVGGDITQTYASSTSDEYGDLIGEDGEYIHQYDAQANTNALLDNTGAVEAQYKYTAFGEVAAVSVEGGAWTDLDTWATLTADQGAGLSADGWAGLPAELSTNMLAGGKKQYYLDPETELYLLGSGHNGRYYDAATARFMSEDPIRQHSGDPNLPNLPNLFAYVENNPINKLDPSGHDSASDEARKRQEEMAREAQQKNQARKIEESFTTSMQAPSHQQQARRKSRRHRHKLLELTPDFHPEQAEKTISYNFMQVTRDSENRSKASVPATNNSTPTTQPSAVTPRNQSTTQPAAQPAAQSALPPNTNQAVPTGQAGAAEAANKSGGSAPGANSTQPSSPTLQNQSPSLPATPGSDWDQYTKTQPVDVNKAASGDLGNLAEQKGNWAANAGTTADPLSVPSQAPAPAVTNVGDLKSSDTSFMTGQQSNAKSPANPSAAKKASVPPPTPAAPMDKRAELQKDLRDLAKDGKAAQERGDTELARTKAFQVRLTEDKLKLYDLQQQKDADWNNGDRKNQAQYDDQIKAIKAHIQAMGEDLHSDKMSGFLDDVNIFSNYTQNFDAGKGIVKEASDKFADKVEDIGLKSNNQYIAAAAGFYAEESRTVTGMTLGAVSTAEHPIDAYQAKVDTLANVIARNQDMDHPGEFNMLTAVRDGLANQLGEMTGVKQIVEGVAGTDIDQAKDLQGMARAQRLLTGVSQLSGIVGGAGEFLEGSPSEVPGASNAIGERGGFANDLGGAPKAVENVPSPRVPEPVPAPESTSKLTESAGPPPSTPNASSGEGAAGVKTPAGETTPPVQTSPEPPKINTPEFEPPVDKPPEAKSPTPAKKVPPASENVKPPAAREPVKAPEAAPQTPAAIEKTPPEGTPAKSGVPEASAPRQAIDPRPSGQGGDDIGRWEGEGGATNEGPQSKNVSPVENVPSPRVPESSELPSKLTESAGPAPSTPNASSAEGSAGAKTPPAETTPPVQTAPAPAKVNAPEFEPPVDKSPALEGNNVKPPEAKSPTPTTEVPPVPENVEPPVARDPVKAPEAEPQTPAAIEKTPPEGTPAKPAQSEPESPGSGGKPDNDSIPKGEEHDPSAHTPRTGAEFEKDFKNRYGEDNVKRMTKDVGPEGKSAAESGESHIPRSGNEWETKFVTVHPPHSRISAGMG